MMQSRKAFSLRPSGDRPDAGNISGRFLRNASADSVNAAFFLGLVGLAVLLRLVPVVTSQVLLYDEISSYLVATGHAAEYFFDSGVEPLPVMDWAPASAWQRYLEVEQGSSLATVITDLQSADLHPPLYFFVLRGWTQLFGNSFLAGKLLSWLLDIACFVLLIWSGKTLLSSKSSGWLTGLLWLVSPVAILGGSTIRPYSLLTLITIMFTLLLGQILLKRPSPLMAKRLTVALLLTAILGLLTHLVFGLILCAAFVAVIAMSQDPRHRRILVPLLALLASAIAVALFLPESLLLNRYLLPRISAVEFETGLLGKFARRSLLLLLPLAVPFGAYLAAIVSARVQHRPLSLDAGDNSRATLRFVLIMLAVPFALHGALYLTGIFYGYAISDHHVVYLTPLVALVAVAWLDLLPKTAVSRLATSAVLVGLLLIPAVRIGQDLPDSRGTVDLDQLAQYDLLVIDNVSRLTLFNYMDPGSVVYAAHQYDLLAQPEDWLPRLVDEGGVYVSLVHSGRYAIGDAEGRDKILALIEQNNGVRLLGTMRQDGTFVSVYEVGN